MIDSIKNLFLPEQASTLGKAVDVTFVLYLGIAAAIFGVFALTVLLLTYRYLKRRPGQTAAVPSSENRLLPALLVLPALAVCSGLFCLGIKDFGNMKVAPNNAIEIQARADNGQWSFSYIQGATVNTLVVPAHQPVRLVMTARQNVHSLFIPSFRVKQDAVPGRYAAAWFTPTRTGNVNLFYTSFSSGPSPVRGAAKVIGLTEFNEWITEISSPIGDMTPMELGKFLFNKKLICVSCHVLDGPSPLAPSMAGLFGSERNLQSGETVTADSAYIAKSLSDPKADVAAGFDAVMATYTLTDQELSALITFIKSL